MISQFIVLASNIASIVDQKERTKYLDEILEIYKDLDDEERKTIPDDGVISALNKRLMRLAVVPKYTVDRKTT